MAAVKFLAENWVLIVAAVAVGACIGVEVYQFTKKPKEAQTNTVLSWLLWAVTEAEKEFGSGTGQLKLSFVYNMFIERFDYWAELISFEQFSNLVDIALEKMRSLLQSNKAIAAYVAGTDTTSTSDKTPTEPDTEPDSNPENGG